MNLFEYVNNIKDKKIAVIGMGVSNTPWIRLLLLSGCSVTVCDKRNIEELGSTAFEFLTLGCKLRLGDNYLDNLNFDIIFRTPGLMPFDEHLVEAEKNGALVTSEMEVFLSLCPCKVIAVTGSDGKTTTTTVISELLKAAGYTVHIGGNIGNPLLCELPRMKSSDIAVLELSSFQLHSMMCSPDVSVITNISPNHLDKHKDYEDYINAKSFIFKNQRQDAVLVLNANNEFSSRYAAEAPGCVRYFSDTSKPENGAYCEDGKIYTVTDGNAQYIMQADDIRIPGNHNLQNYLTAFAAVKEFVSPEICRDVAVSFGGVEHRLEEVRIIKGVKFINDSIGTSPTRTIAGLKALKTKPVLILGGYDKHIPFDTLGDEVCLRAKEVYLTGATAEKIYNSITASVNYEKSGLKLTVADDFKECVYEAASHATEGDIILLSPACAAFDKFKNFMERGKYFKQIVMELTDENIGNKA